MMMHCAEDEPQFFDEHDFEDELIVGIDCCEHGVTSPTGCDDCYDKKSDSFSIVRAMEKI